MLPKRLFRLTLFNLASLTVAERVLAGVDLIGGMKIALYAALILTAINYIIKPLVKLLLLPVNLLTMGSFRWLTNVAALYLLTFIVPQVSIKSFYFDGYAYQGFSIPSMSISFFWAYVLTSLVISFSTTFLLWLRK